VLAGLGAMIMLLA